MSSLPESIRTGSTHLTRPSSLSRYFFPTSNPLESVTGSLRGLDWLLPAAPESVVLALSTVAEPENSAVTSSSSPSSNTL